ncbi:hypothetical protein D3C71_1083620 [compost metagenome]
MRDAGHALAVAVVGVGGDVDVVARDRVVVGREIDGDPEQAIPVVIGIVHGGGRDAARDSADLGQIGTAVVVVADIPIGVGDGLHGSVAVVGVADGVAVGVSDGDQATSSADLVALDAAGFAVGPDELGGTTVVGNGVEGPRAVRADVAAAGRVPGVDRLGPVAIGAREGASGRSRCAGRQHNLLAEGSHAPVVAVVVAEQALAVVGAYGLDVESAAHEDIVTPLQHEVAVGDVDKGLLAASALPCSAQLATLAQRSQGTQAQAQTVTADDCNHFTASKFPVNRQTAAATGDP